MPLDSSPFHAGEHAVQQRLGVRDIEDWARKVVRDHMPDDHRAFHSALPFLVAAARDGEGRPWATLLVGDENFISAPDRRTLMIDALPPAGDALTGALGEGADLGLLGIELASRRRNRINGRLAVAAARGLHLSVEQTFGNCPQYIRERDWRRIEDFRPGTASRTDRLSTGQRDWIASADTFFIATGYRGEGEDPTFGMDASHRGGEAGFVEVIGSKRIRFPDYAGNNHYNTIGNLTLDSRVGLLFVAFAEGSLLQLSGRAEIDWDSEALARFPGARRLVSVTIEAVVEMPNAVPLRWDASAGSVRSLRLIEKIAESADVTSFLFEARDGGLLPSFEAGQHLPIELTVPGFSEPIKRTYSLSSGPSNARYRISVKRESHGIASRHLHDVVSPGEIVESRNPAGDFLLSCAECPIVLVSAGVGLTPMVSMLHALAAEAGERRVWFVHGARDGAHHPLAHEVRSLAALRPGIDLHVSFSEPLPSDQLGVDFNSEGRIDGALLARLVEARDAHYFLCGPTSFMAQVQQALEDQGVPEAQIHTESFGPKG